MSKQTGVICRLSMKISEEMGAFVARCGELGISNHGKTMEQAQDNLQKSVELYFEVCAEKGTLFSVLSEKGVLYKSYPVEDKEVIEVPIPVGAMEYARKQAC